MEASQGRRVLTMNRGSATLKAAIYDVQSEPKRSLSISVDRADQGGQIRISDHVGTSLFNGSIIGDSSSSLEVVFNWLADRGHLSELAAVGHRLVHGGAEHTKPERITPELLPELDQLGSIDPHHMPAAVAGIRFVAQKYPGVPQIACFDPAFHTSLPRVAQMYAIPRTFFNEGIRRFGFHGLSYEYISQELRNLKDPAANGKVIVAHLGSGASICAVLDGKSVDTSMGFTPLEGLVMGTRSGDIDAGAVLYVLKQKKISPEEMDKHLNKRSGLLGVSGTSEDMRDLLEKASKGDAQAEEAIELFCYRVKKYIGAYAAVLGGIDILVFTAGIGERAAPVRARICKGLEFLGIQLDADRNKSNASIISTSTSRAKVRVIETNEDLMIVRHVVALLGWT